MITTTTDAAPAPAPAVGLEVCTVCDSTDVRAFESDWFALALDRDQEIRGVAAVRFACRDCGSAWD